MKNISKIFIALSLLCLATACHEESMHGESINSTSNEVGVFGDEMRLKLGIVAPDPIEIGTRAVDPDGKALQSLVVFCFDSNGLLISTSTAKVTPNPSAEDYTEGIIDVNIPIATRIIHFVGNQNMSRFDKNTFTNKSEDEVLSILEGSAGMLIYWARVEAPANVNALYTDALYKLEDGNVVTASEARRTEPEAVVDWLTIETNPESEVHRGINGKGFPIILLRNQARFSIESTGWEDFKETNPVTGVTSQPKDTWKGQYFEVTGFAICNSPAFGTVAPYHTNYGFPTYKWSGYTPYYGVTEGVKGNWVDDNNSVTLPARRDKLTNATDVSNAKDQFIFETTNSSTDPVDIILRGYNIVNGEREGVERYYYRVNVIDENGEMITIRRNHRYIINIVDNLTNGCQSFEEALRAPATNNIWFSIADEVKAVRDDKIELSVEKTKVIVNANVLEEDYFYTSMQSFQFNVKKLKADDATELDPSKLTVRWIEDNQQVSSTYNPDLMLGGDYVSFDPSTGEGLVNIQLNLLPEGEEMVRGTLLVKYGRLQRKIHVIVVRQQSFVPAWVSSEVYGKLTGDNYNGENVTVIFNIPETCPKELFPMKVLVTTNNLDGRATSGQILPIVTKGDDGYGDEFQITVNEGTEDEKTLTDLGYKYEYTVDAPGQHRLYFRNIFEAGEGDLEYVILQADNFEIIAKPVTFVNHTNKILMPGLRDYSAIPDADKSEVIQYILVPQKRFAPVTFDISLKVSDGTNFGTLNKEEFLLYSTNIDHYRDEDSRIGDKYSGASNLTVEVSDFDCYFKSYEESLWGTGGRIFGFYPRKEKIANGTFLSDSTFNGVKHDVFQIFLETNKPKSAEVVRIASNQTGSPSVKENANLYDGLTFRSTTFELANYRPFRFAAQVNGEGNYVADDATSGTQNPEVIDDIKFTYHPDDIVEVSFDITSFKADDGSSVDPFGTGFEIFIDAPMLKLEYGMNVTNDFFKDKFEDLQVPMYDKDVNGEGYIVHKPKLQDLGNGRFVYRVNAHYGPERGYWPGSYPLIQDPTRDREYTKGDRKTIRFRKNSIVSQGNIVISANPDHVNYHSKTFVVSNAPINGRIGYVPVDEDGNELGPVTIPADQFVSFSRIYDDSRIGSLIVKAYNEAIPFENTYYDLRLRGEYEFNWENDPIRIQTQIGGEFYSTTIPDLKYLYNNTTILLNKE